MLAAAFFSSSGGSVGVNAPPECATVGFWKQFARNIAIGTVTSLVSAIPVVVVLHAQSRDISFFLSEHDAKRKALVRKWHYEDCMIWVVGLAYVIFDMLFCLSLL